MLCCVTLMHALIRMDMQIHTAKHIVNMTQRDGCQYNEKINTKILSGENRHITKMLLLLIASKEGDSGKPVTNLKYYTFELQKHVNSDRH